MEFEVSFWIVFGWALITRPATDLPISSMKPRHQGKVHHMDQSGGYGYFPAGLIQNGNKNIAHDCYILTTQLGDWGMDIDGSISMDIDGYRPQVMIQKGDSEIFQSAAEGLAGAPKWMKTMTRGDKLIGFPEFGSIHWIMVGMADEGVEALPNKNQAPHKMLLGSCLKF